MSENKKPVRKAEQKINLLVNRLSIVTCLGERSLCSQTFVCCMIDSSDQSGAACFSSGDKMHRHDTFNPWATRELKHVIPSRIAACTRGNVLLRYHILDIQKRIGRGNHKQLVYERLHVFHSSFQIVDGVLVLELEVAFVVVNTGYDEATKFS